MTSHSNILFNPNVPIYTEEQKEKKNKFLESMGEISLKAEMFYILIFKFNIYGLLIEHLNGAQ